MTDVLEGLIPYLKADAAVAALVGMRAFGLELPATEAASMPRKAVVLRPSGNAGSVGDRGYTPISRPRIDFLCYGETPYEGAKLYSVVRDAVKNMRTNTTAGVRLYNATLSGGPISDRDPDTDWPFTFGSWGVEFAEVS